MSDILKSLLDKSAGTQTGELIGAYLSGRDKKDNKARNVLLASLFFNAKEAAMQSKVLKQLKDLEEEKTLEIQNAAYAFDKGLEKQNQYDAVQKQGINNYYDALAEDAFYNIENHKTQRSFYDNEDKGLSAKEAWKSDWSKNKHNQFLETYDADAPRLTTIENFNKPINDYFKAKKENIASPQNISLVHNVLGKIGIGNKRDEEVAKVEAGYQGDILSSSKDLVSVVGALGTNFIPAEIKKKDIKIRPDSIRDLLVDDYGEDITGDIRNEVLSRFNARAPENQTYGEYVAISQATVNGRFLIAEENNIKKYAAQYDAFAKTEGGMTKEKNRFIRGKLGLSRPSDDVLDASTEYANLVADVLELSGDERTEFIDKKIPEFVETTVNRLVGVRNEDDFFNEVRGDYLIQLTNQISSGAAQDAINRTAITREFTTNLPPNLQGIIGSNAFDFLNEVTYDYDKIREEINSNSNIGNQLKLLQEEQYKLNANTILESLLYYSANYKEKLKPKEELPPGFTTSTTFSGDPNTFL